MAGAAVARSDKMDMDYMRIGDFSVLRVQRERNSETETGRKTETDRECHIILRRILRTDRPMYAHQGHAVGCRDSARHPDIPSPKRP